MDIPVKEDDSRRYTKTLGNGIFWNQLTLQWKAHYVYGYMEGVSHAARAAFERDLPKDTDTWPPWTIAVVPHDMSLGELCDILDILYRDPDSLAIPIVVMISIGILSSRGVATAQIESMLVRAQLFYGDSNLHNDERPIEFAYCC